MIIVIHVVEVKSYKTQVSENVSYHDGNFVTKKTGVCLRCISSSSSIVNFLLKYEKSQYSTGPGHNKKNSPDE